MVPEILRLQNERGVEDDLYFDRGDHGTLMPTRSAKPGNEADMIPLLKRHEIRVLLKAGFTVADVATRTSTSADTVARVRD
jgi:hypothetical protein